MGSGYLRLYGNVAQLQLKQQQQQQFWHQRYIRDVGASKSASLQQQQQENHLKDSSTEVSLEQPQGRQAKICIAQ